MTVIRGCMFAGKTARLIELLEAARQAGRRTVACKHRLDVRYDPTRLITHDGRSFPAIAVGGATEIPALAANAETVGIDEAQFFGRRLVSVVHGLVEAGAAVIVAGIHHDAWGQDFPPLPELGGLAGDVVTLTAPCGVCGRPAEYTQRITPVIAGNLVGGPGDFEPRCPTHFTPLPPPAPRYA